MKLNMKINYNYIFIIISILLLISLISVIHIQKNPIIIDTNTVEFFENIKTENKKNKTQNLDSREKKDNLEIQPSTDTVNKKGSNLVIDFIDPPARVHNTMKSLFMKWTKVNSQHFNIIRYYQNNIYGLDKDGHVWKGSLNNDKIEKFIKTGSIKNIQISNNFIYGTDKSGKLYKHNLDGSGKWEQISQVITNHVFTIHNSIIYTISDGRLATMGLNSSNMNLGAKADIRIYLF